MPFSPLPEIFEDLRSGRMVILVDDPDRENEGDLVMAAEFTRPEDVAFYIRHGSGIVCVTMPQEKADALDLPLQVSSTTNSSRFGTQFTVTIEAKEGVTTGVSAADRAQTIRTVARDDCGPADLARPGHVYPIRAAHDGVLRRSGQTEGSVDLCRLAGLRPLGVITELMHADGTMMRLPALETFAASTTSRSAASATSSSGAAARNASSRGRPAPSSPPRWATSPSTPTPRRPTPSPTSRSRWASRCPRTAARTTRSTSPCSCGPTASA